MFHWIWKSFEETSPKDSALLWMIILGTVLGLVVALLGGNIMTLAIVSLVAVSITILLGEILAIVLAGLFENPDMGSAVVLGGLGGILFGTVTIIGSFVGFYLWKHPVVVLSILAVIAIFDLAIFANKKIEENKLRHGKG